MRRQSQAQRAPARLMQPFEDGGSQWDDGAAPIHSMRTKTRASNSAAERSSDSPTSSQPEDRLNALYQRFRTPSTGERGCSRGDRAGRMEGELGATTVGCLPPSPPPHQLQAPRCRGRTVQYAPHQVDSLETVAHPRESGSGDSPPPLRPTSSTSTPVREQTDVAVDATSWVRRPGREAPSGTQAATTFTATPRRRGETPRAAVLSGAASAESTVTLPPSLSSSGIPALMHTARHVWAVLGFFEVPAVDGDGEGLGTMQGEGRGRNSSGPEDTASFLWELQMYLNMFRPDTSNPPAAELASKTALMRNGLWRVLFNAVFYCVSTLDQHRCRRGTLPRRELEVCTGGAEDAYEVVYSSSTNDDDGDESEEVEGAGAPRGSRAVRTAPVRLTWRRVGESEVDCMARCMQDPLPPGCTVGDVTASTIPSNRAGGNSVRAARDAAMEAEGPPQSPPRSLADAYGQQMRSPLPARSWYFVLRCLAQVGYRRDAFYLQTPSMASPHELLLALLWLTREYKLIGVAEYVELDRLYPFLLLYRADGSLQRRTAANVVGAQRGIAMAQDRLLHRISSASVWPPVSFDEEASLVARLRQLERCLGSASAAASTRTPPACQVRRLLAVRRLIDLSFNRVHQCLQRQVEQVALLGLHSPLDVQLCRKEHHAIYEEVLAGLGYLQEAEKRLQLSADCLCQASSLVAFLLRYDDSTVPADDVLSALEEDDATWLARGGSAARELPDDDTSFREGRHLRTKADRWRCAAQRGGFAATHEGSSTAVATSAAELRALSAASLTQALSAFRASHMRTTLTEMWKRLWRRSQVAPNSIPKENLYFLLDTEAQHVQQVRVKENMRSRYSLQAALAAELAVLGYQKHHRSTETRTSLSTDDEDIIAKTRDSALSSPLAADSIDEVAPEVQVAMPPLNLVTNASSAFAELHAEDELYGPVALGSDEVQLTEVGEPAAGSTTSARLEIERLDMWEQQELDAQLMAPADTVARVEHCKRLLATLYHKFNLRVAAPVAREGESGREEKVAAQN